VKNLAKHKYKIMASLLLMVVLLSFNQCVSPLVSTPRTNIKLASDNMASPVTNKNITASRAVLLDGFNKTVYPVVRAHCVACHGSAQTPLFGSSDVNTAFDAVMNSSKVDLNNPGNSRIVLKLLNEKHNCWGVCADNAKEIEDQITQWYNLLGSNQIASTSYGPTTRESLTVQEALNPTSISSDVVINLMCEAASLKSPMISGNENSVSYVWAPLTSTNKDLTSTDAGTAIISYSVPFSDFYKIFILVNAPSTTQNMVYIKAAGSDYKEWTTGVTSGFEWREVTNTPSKLDTEFYMVTGKTYTLEMRQKQVGVKLAKVIITNDLTYDPTMTPKALLKATLSIPIADLTGIADALFEIDIEDFDLYSYKVSNPRIKSSKNISVKALKVLVNGKFNPQHATYLVVDKTVSPMDTSLSSASMILLKDKGAEYDKLSFAFETIQAVK
jgi:hypothetical protein